MNYNNLTNPEIVAAVGGLEGVERTKALASLGDDRRKEVEAALTASMPFDGARAAVLERLGREKQISDSQAWTSDGVSPNSPLVTEAAAAKFTEAPAPEAVLDTLTADTQAKAEASADVVAGKDTSATLSSKEAAGVDDGSIVSEDGVAEAVDAGKKKGKLPESFPGKAELEAAGFDTYAKVRKLRDGDGFASVAGIGSAKASQIEEAIKE